jgi:phage terminase small subunit
MDALGLQDYIFIGTWLVNHNGAKAYRIAHPEYTGYFAAQNAADLLRQPRIRAEIERCKANACAKATLCVDDVVRDIQSVLMADSRELIEQRRHCCRYCHGVAHGYQRTPQQERDAWAAYLESVAYKEGKPFDPMGGIGYTTKREPHPECPECHGEGVLSTVMHDTRNLSQSAATLYAGTKPTANGIEVLTRSKDQARKDAAAYLGMNKETLLVKSSTVAVALTTTDPIEAANAYSQIMKAE